MDTFSYKLSGFSKLPLVILDNEIAIQKYVPLDLSVANKDFRYLQIMDPSIRGSFINIHLRNEHGISAYGDYPGICS